MGTVPGTGTVQAESRYGTWYWVPGTPARGPLLMYQVPGTCTPVRVMPGDGFVTSLSPCKPTLLVDCS